MMKQNNNIFYKTKFKALIKRLNEENFDNNINLLMDKKNKKDERDKLLNIMAKKFVKVEKYATELTEEDKFLKYFLSKLLLYYKPIETLERYKKIEETILWLSLGLKDIASKLKVDTNKSTLDPKKSNFNHEKSYRVGKLEQEQLLKAPRSEKISDIRRLPDLN